MSEEPTPYKTDAPTSNAFMRVLQTHADGDVCAQLAEAMRQCVEAAQLSGRAATLKLEVSFKAASKGAANAMIIVPSVSTKLPKAEQPSSIWFADIDGSLHRDDPRQRNLPLKTVETPDIAGQPLRKIKAS